MNDNFFNRTIFTTQPTDHSYKHDQTWDVLGTRKSSHSFYFSSYNDTVLREMWALEYEVDELQHKFADSIGKMDLDNLDVDFIEDMMLKAKPLQTVLNDIRNRQIVSSVVCGDEASISLHSRHPD